MFKAPELINIGIKLSPADSTLFKKPNGQLEDVIEAVKTSRKKKKGKVKAKIQDAD
ncbi:hypothetical protein B0H13DRAFT_2371910 [Mycena leptocephala]|nr:hypothetical protein B0H13DRAFT_2371910 [Mycena leptocephala]